MEAGTVAGDITTWSTQPRSLPPAMELDFTYRHLRVWLPENVKKLDRQFTSPVMLVFLVDPM